MHPLRALQARRSEGAHNPKRLATMTTKQRADAQRAAAKSQNRLRALAESLVEEPA